jgi:hypothetical protein
MKAIPLVVLTLLVLCQSARAAERLPPSAPAAAAPRTGRLEERFGMELGLVGIALMNTSSPDPRYEPNIDPVRLGGLTLILRCPTLRWRRFRWTTLEFGGGGFLSGGLTLALLADSSPGVAIVDARNWLLTVNLGVGYGIHMTKSGMEEDSFGGGGYGILLVPTLRVSGRASWANVGTSLRCILAQKSLTADSMRRYGALLLLAFDLGW